MKKILTAVCIIACTTCFSQKFQFGAKAGANISNFAGGNFDDVDKKSIVGFHGGVYLRFQMFGFAIQPEAMVSSQGARIDSVSGSYDWKVTYVNVPVMLQYRLPIGIYLEFGPQVGFKLEENIENETLKDFAKQLDLSFAAGLGFRARKGLGVGARYTVGVSKVGDFDPPNNIDPDFKNSVIQLSLYIPLTR